MRFRPEERTKIIPITIIDDDVFEEEEHFNIRLSNLRVQWPDSTIEAAPSAAQLAAGKRFPAKLDDPFVAVVTILDDDHAGV